MYLTMICVQCVDYESHLLTTLPLLPNNFSWFTANEFIWTEKDELPKGEQPKWYFQFWFGFGWLIKALALTYPCQS